jgi:LacI family transcriptional regulator
VLAAASALHYVSNGPAQALARASTALVGLVVHDVADPYFSAIAAGAMRIARAHDLMVMVAATFRDPGLELEYLSRLRVQRARAVLLAGSGFSDPDYTARLTLHVAALEEQGVRIACVGFHGIAADTVLPGNAEGAAQAVQHLWGLGHRRIGIVSGPPELATVRDRLDGARHALASFGAALPPERVVEADFTREGGRVAALTLFRRAPGLTGVLALNDVMASGVLAALRELGRSVPGDVSVVGFDDVPQAADLHPALTTVRLPLEEIGAQAMRLVVGDRAGGGPRLVPVSAALVPRASTGSAPMR